MAREGVNTEALTPTEAVAAMGIWGIQKMGFPTPEADWKGCNEQEEAPCQNDPSLSSSLSGWEEQGFALASPCTTLI